MPTKCLVTVAWKTGEITHEVMTEENVLRLASLIFVTGAAVGIILSVRDEERRQGKWEWWTL
jgi:hypothetical protein